MTAAGNRPLLRTCRGWAAAALIAAAAVPAPASQFGVPVGVGDPAGYLTLVSPDAINSGISDAFGDFAHKVTFYVEVTNRRLTVELYDPGLFRPGGPATQLDWNFGSTPSVALMRYIVYDPDGAVQANTAYGSDTAGTDRQVVQLYNANNAQNGIWTVECLYEDGVGIEEDISVFGVRFPGLAAWTWNLTAGHVNLAGATIVEPVSIYPWLVSPSPGTDAMGPVCGVSFHSYDLDADSNGTPPPNPILTSSRGYTFPADTIPPSGDARFWKTDLGGVPYGWLDSDDQGLYRWSFDGLSSVDETLFDNVAPMNVNIFSVQVLDYAVADRDFFNWPVLPPVMPENPRRLYLPLDNGASPDRENLGHRAQIVAGYPVLTVNETSTVEVTISLRNPNSYALSNTAGRTYVAPDAILTDPYSLTSTGGLNAVVDPGNPRRINWSGSVAAGATGEVRYRVDISPTVTGTYYLTGDGTAYLTPATPTTSVYEAPYTRVGDPPQVLGPVCEIQYQVVPHPCDAIPVLTPSATNVCPGTVVNLSSAGSDVIACPGGVPIFRWLINGVEKFPYPAAPSIDETVFLDGDYTLEVMCSTDTNCVDSMTVRITTYPGVGVDVGADQNLCLGDAVTLNAVLSAGTPPFKNFLWTTNPAGQPGDGATTLSINVSPTVATTYTFSAADSLDCTGSDATVLAVDVPTARITPQNPVLCPGGTVDLRGPAGMTSWTWSTNPPGLPGDGAATRTITANTVGATYTLNTVGPAPSLCPAQDAVTTTGANDAIPGALGWTLRMAKVAGTDDLLATWLDIPDPAGEYHLVSLDGDSDFNGTYDQVPLVATMTVAPFVSVLVGQESYRETGGLVRPSWLVFYKARAASPCSRTPGPFAP